MSFKNVAFRRTLSRNTLEQEITSELAFRFRRIVVELWRSPGASIPIRQVGLFLEEQGWKQIAIPLFNGGRFYRGRLTTYVEIMTRESLTAHIRPLTPHLRKSLQLGSMGLPTTTGYPIPRMFSNGMEGVSFIGGIGRENGYAVMWHCV